ncbi:MAG TPA: hypothetical protein VM186_12695, partial [Planctomycetota bacterium]|nr:hypothetical protein [Planctomycetota bacterium]
PMPGTGLEALKPGGRIYELDNALIKRLRKDGYGEPAIWWSQTHHFFEKCTDDEVPPECAGRAISIYSCWTGITTKGWLGGPQIDKIPQPSAVWPVRPPLTFAEGNAPELVIARPESWMADRTRHDNLIALMLASKTPLAITSLGTVPSEIPGAAESAQTGWQMKQRGLTRSLAFWLNQGAPYVLLHSAYESRNDEMSHALIPFIADPLKFRWQDAPPLVTLRSFCDALKNAKPLRELDPLKFKFAVEPNPVLIPPSANGGSLTAADAVALLPYQLDERTFAVAAYVVSTNIADRLQPLRMTLQIDRRIGDAGVAWSQPSCNATGTAAVVERNADFTTIDFDVHDDVTWLTFAVE